MDAYINRYRHFPVRQVVVDDYCLNQFVIGDKDNIVRQHFNFSSSPVDVDDVSFLTGFDFYVVADLDLPCNYNIKAREKVSECILEGKSNSKTADT